MAVLSGFIALGLGACSSDDNGGGGGAGTTSFVGTVVGENNESGSLAIDIAGTALAPPASLTTMSSAALTATGTLTLVTPAAGTQTLSGTYDPATDELDLSGGGIRSPETSTEPAGCKEPTLATTASDRSSRRWTPATHWPSAAPSAGTMMGQLEFCGEWDGAFRRCPQFVRRRHSPGRDCNRGGGSLSTQAILPGRRWLPAPSPVPPRPEPGIPELVRAEPGPDRLLNS